MNQILENKLLERFPWMIAHNLWTCKKLDFCTPCECQDGWYQLIYDLCEEIENHYKKNNVDINTIRIDQIKEKFANLRFYISNVIEGTYDIVGKYENLSIYVCEVCGDKGEVCIQGTWLKCLCEKCRDKLGYRDCKEFYED
jgi:hypothetical protein